ncbi:cytochrome c-type biogenesis protein CcmE [Legionella oakridgensis ATCC 33761 = DSM 21215]|uniref:Cytochrome c-type biogenesis protein CcmE n=3 Tax=Legionella oakridgensis TaxID=29423 RepID=W0BEH7_9GAMM|nr:cytochrome c-type biogenesis protein CcmE [Legionella oakridgensis ATCC 33761 = DSM 21215]ETO93517.1 cytochrome c-type biogenesis protein CcmE [Legionella oakridgensis RV-2-2007]KTD39799.1 cytochrome c-type biogenesis protein CcmE [Legionella oakridgensis]STY19921.1 cytochrome c-type biogenesis protein CcmE [Legionella longbeachae]
MLLLVVAILSVATALVLYALRQNISLFYTPTQVAAGEAPLHRAVRVGGMVVKGSVVRDTNDLSVRFRVTDFQNTVEIVYRGILPDLFREEQGIVAQGQLTAKGHFQATEVLAKHDENYMPPEVKAALAKNGRTS